VNLASRLEGLTKYYGARIVTTRFTLESIRQSGQTVPTHRVLDSVKVKGKDHAVELIQVFEWAAQEEGIRRFEEGRKLYTARKWDDAIQAFHEANALLRRNLDEDDGPSLLYVERCEGFKQTPPDADWDGSWKMTSK
jgi:adenylate cyclase